MPLYGDGLNVRDWLYVTDNCVAVDLVLRRGTAGEIYNIGADNERTNRELTDRVLGLLGKDETSVEYVADRLGHDRRYSVDCDKVRALGWVGPARPFEETLAETVQFYVDRPDWWEPLLERVKNR